MVDRTNVTASPDNVGPGSAFVRGQMIEAQPAPVSSSGLIGWVRANLFPSVSQGVLTVVCLYVLYLIIPPLVSFLFTDAVWSGADRTACATEAQGGIQPNGWFGACWAYVGDYTNQFIYGRYPDEEQWRVNIVALLMALAIGPLLAPDLPYKGVSIFYAAVIFPVAALVLLTGGHFDVAGSYLPLAVIGLLALAGAFAFAKGSDSDPLPGMKLVGIIVAALFVVLFVLGFDFGLERVNTEVWGGLLVTMVIAVSGIAASLPIGILLALGRRSQMPIVKFVCVVFIEFWRGVPLITVLFMSSVMLPLFLPEGVSFDKLLRALIGVALFSSAYMAEVVRGGLQALPKGQYEGAMALGLNWGQMTRMIILPQALKLVIPGIVNTFIGLFKDTTLVLIIGLFDFLGSIRASTSDPTWSTPVQSMTGLTFAAIVYFIFCYAMSRYSMYMERRLDTGHKS